MSEATDTKSGLWDSFRRILDNLLATIENRAELFAVEVQEEKCRVVEVMLCAGCHPALNVELLSRCVNHRCAAKA